MTLRINITISEKSLEIIDKSAEENYNGNRSQFLSDAGLEYSEKLSKRQDKTSKGKKVRK